MVHSVYSKNGRKEIAKKLMFPLRRCSCNVNISQNIYRGHSRREPVHLSPNALLKPDKSQLGVKPRSPYNWPRGVLPWTPGWQGILEIPLRVSGCVGNRCKRICLFKASSSIHDKISLTHLKVSQCTSDGPKLPGLGRGEHFNSHSPQQTETDRSVFSTKNKLNSIAALLSFRDQFVQSEKCK